jgi:acetylornithine deacetylase/succinyl-diaminopimelate desuccinylase-like protein
LAATRLLLGHIDVVSRDPDDWQMTDGWMWGLGPMSA